MSMSSPNHSELLPASGSAVSGCKTCKVRKKRCPRDFDATGVCGTCHRLRVECLRDDAEWMRDRDDLQAYRQRLSGDIASGRRLSRRVAAASVMELPPSDDAYHADTIVYIPPLNEANFRTVRRNNMMATPNVDSVGEIFMPSESLPGAPPFSLSGWDTNSSAGPSYQMVPPDLTDKGGDLSGASPDIDALYGMIPPSSRDDY
ncbi:uncharacterized protein EI90DRAFT_159300 [Cantharellus anzutake]|uniref:uncharacterized protein n=1 Tax=Cantharellus anzutake TaxID=1750568 RepID=UPI00190801A2|nr:uncharacterized protein EI90DRAFT_159300 [Cantharellus anzutake]KAF8336321.1 hypothetical protein EI90DRAFT_159300 [Cantharellus anzutake]